MYQNYPLVLTFKLASFLSVQLQFIYISLFSIQYNYSRANLTLTVDVTVRWNEEHVIDDVNHTQGRITMYHQLLIQTQLKWIALKQQSK